MPSFWYFPKPAHLIEGELSEFLNFLIVISNSVTSKEVSVEVKERCDKDKEDLVQEVKVVLLLKVVIRKKVVSKSHGIYSLLKI